VHARSTERHEVETAMFEPGQFVRCKLADPMMRPVGERLTMNVVSVAGGQVTVTWEDKEHCHRTETLPSDLLELVPGNH
jgi:hypothetical protein